MSLAKRGVVRSKKANVMHEVYFIIFEVLLLLIVALALYQFEANWAKGLDFSRRFTAADLGVFMTALYGMPGTVQAMYAIPQTENEWELLLKDGKIEIREQGKPLVVTNVYAQDRNIDKFSHLFGFESLFLSKTGEQVTASFDEANLKQLRCPRVIIGKIGWEYDQDILISTGFHKGQATEDVILEQTSVKKIKEQLTGVPAFSFEKTNQKIAVLLHIAHHDETNNALRAYVKSDPADPENFLKSKKLACNILNNMMTSSANYSFAQIVPVDSALIEAEKDMLQDLNEFGVAVAIEIGNPVIAGKHTGLIANGIKEGIRKYFET